MASSPVSVNAENESDNDSGGLALNESQGNEIVTNLSAKTPVWKHFGFPGNGKGAPRTS